jgi:hypothetical protein
MRRSQSIKDNLENNQPACRSFFERLNERDQRHVAGLLALAIGHDGITLVGNIMGLTRDTVAKGKKELLNNLADVPEDRVRSPGAGRPAQEKKIQKKSKPSKNS